MVTSINLAVVSGGDVVVDDQVLGEQSRLTWGAGRGGDNGGGGGGGTQRHTTHNRTSRRWQQVGGCRGEGCARIGEGDGE